MKMKKIVSFLLVLSMAVSLLSGCGNQKTDEKKETTIQTTTEEKEKVTVAFWGNQLQASYARYLCDTFPDVEFEFVLASNSTDFYRYRQEHGDMPDILTVRRFALKDAVQLKDYLYDFSDTDLASDYYGTYLKNYTYDDGTVNWLPVCAEVDSFIINETLFEEYHIPIPTDYDSFIAACEAFEEVGIQGYVSDFANDYTCMEVLQGLSSTRLMSMEGINWRQKYESGITDQLSEEVWLPVFEKFFDMKEKTGLGEEEAAMNFDDVKKMFTEGRAAMYRGTGNDIVACPGRGEDKVVLMPYFGETENDNWYLTYPAFQVAAGSQGMDDPEREELILDIMAAMLDQEGQSHISYGQNMVSYNKNVTLELLPELENLKSYINDNKMYIRLASNEMFSISQSVVQKILTGELKTPGEAFDAFNAELNSETPKSQTVAHIDRTYSNEFTQEHGNQAASAICNTIRQEEGADLVFAQASYVSGDICEGDYTEKELSYLTSANGTIVKTELTGEKVFELVQETLSLSDNRGSVCNDSTMYVSSGFEMDIARSGNGYTLDKLTKDGKELDRDAVYSVLIYSDYDWHIPVLKEKVGFEVTNADMSKCVDVLKKRLVEDGGQLEEPTDYITIR